MPFRRYSHFLRFPTTVTVTVQVPGGVGVKVPKCVVQAQTMQLEFDSTLEST